MWIAISALNLLAVMLGAFGAHGLKAHATEVQLAWWQTATDYFFYHALGLLALAILTRVIPQLPIKASFTHSNRDCIFLWLFICHGVRLTTYFRCNYTPIGGALMIAGWLLLAWNAFKYAK